MTSKLRRLLSQGFAVVRSSDRLLFVVALLVVFPLLFLFITHTFLETAQRNVETTEKRRVAMLHDATAVLVSKYEANPDTLREFLNIQKTEQPDILEVRLVRRDFDGYRILESHEDVREGSVETATEVFTLVPEAAHSPYIFEGVSDNARVWNAISSVASNGKTYFIVSVHSFKTFDSVMAARLQQAYLGLTAIFVFLIALAYWFGQQINWRTRYRVLETTLKERDLFTPVIAHEFRTPLTAIRGYTSFLAEAPTLSHKERTYVDAVQKSTERLLALINDFLEVAKIQSGNMKLTVAPVDVQPTIISVVEALQPIAKEKRLDLTFHQLAVPVTLETDVTRLYQVLQNLISNALKYTKEGSVEVSLDVTPKLVSIRIKDTGMGISSEDQQKLFAPFARVGGVEQTKITGTGLGMWITKQLVETLRGSITVESIKGVGTHVIVSFRR